MKSSSSIDELSYKGEILNDFLMVYSVFEKDISKTIAIESRSKIFT